MPSQDTAPAIHRAWWYRPARFIGGACVCYVGVILVLMLLENRLLFHPMRAAEEWLAPPNSRVQDVGFRTGDGTSIHAWWCPVKGWQPEQGALLYCHGNAGNLSHRSETIAQWQQEFEVSVLIFDYPGFGRSEGRPTELGCYAAAEAAYDWLTHSQGVSPQQVLIYGQSLGGGVAVDLASRRPHRALILAKTFSSIPDMAQRIYPWLPARWLVRNRFDSLAKIGNCRKPVFVAHGTADGHVPFSLGERLFAAANEPKFFLTMEGVGHNEGLTSEFFSALRLFLDKAAVARTPAQSATSGN